MANIKTEIGLAANRNNLRQDVILNAAYHRGGLTIPQIAHLSGVSKRKVKNVFLGKYAPTAREYALILAALGYEISFAPVKLGELIDAEREARNPIRLPLTPEDERINDNA